MVKVTFWLGRGTTCVMFSRLYGWPYRYLSYSSTPGNTPGEKNNFSLLWLVYALLKWCSDDRHQMILIIFSKCLTFQILGNKSSLSLWRNAWCNNQKVNIPRTDASQGASFIWATTVKARILQSHAFPLYVLILLIWIVNRSRCRSLILMTSQLPELWIIPLNGLSSVVAPCKVRIQLIPFVRLRVIVLIVLQAFTESTVLTDI